MKPSKCLFEIRGRGRAVASVRRPPRPLPPRSRSFSFVPPLLLSLPCSTDHEIVDTAPDASLWRRSRPHPHALSSSRVQWRARACVRGGALMPPTPTRRRVRAHVRATGRSAAGCCLVFAPMLIRHPLALPPPRSLRHCTAFHQNMMISAFHFAMLAVLCCSLCSRFESANSPSVDCCNTCNVSLGAAATAQ